MLYLLTGEIQTGKTRWLERLVADLTARKISCCGVLSPGIWQKVPGEKGELDATYDKLGIETVLLPSGQRSVFAQRRDLVEANGTVAIQDHSLYAMLGHWVITNAAIDKVNQHFDLLARQRSEPGFLIIDELGRLELLQNRGYTSALRLLEHGPSAQFKDAVIIVRTDLVDLASQRFCQAWDQLEIIHPTAKAQQKIIEALD